MKGRPDPFPNDPKASPLHAVFLRRLHRLRQEMSRALQVFAPKLRCKAARRDSIAQDPWARRAGCASTTVFASNFRCVILLILIPETYLRRIKIVYTLEGNGMRTEVTKRTEPRDSRKKTRTFRLTPGKVEAAQEILGVPTATEAIETALDMVIFRDELVRGTKAALGIEFSESRRRRR
jgi:hypothetical protein